MLIRRGGSFCEKNPPRRINVGQIGSIGGSGAGIAACIRTEGSSVRNGGGVDPGGRPPFNEYAYPGGRVQPRSRRNGIHVREGINHKIRSWRK